MFAIFLLLRVDFALLRVWIEIKLTYCLEIDGTRIFYCIANSRACNTQIYQKFMSISFKKAAHIYACLLA